VEVAEEMATLNTKAQQASAPAEIARRAEVSDRHLRGAGLAVFVPRDREKEVSSALRQSDVYLPPWEESSVNNQSCLKLAACIVALLAATSISQAQTTISVTAGTFMEAGGPYAQFAFQFGVPASYFLPVIYSGSGGYLKGFNRCYSSCTVSQIVGIGKSRPLYLEPNVILTSSWGGT